VKPTTHLRICGDIFCPQVKKSRRIRWAGHEAHMGGQDRGIESFGGETLKETDHLGDPDVDGRIIKKDGSGSSRIGIWGDGLGQPDLG